MVFFYVSVCFIRSYFLLFCFTGIVFLTEWMKTVFGLVRIMIPDATFNNISVILWRSVILMGETGENHRPAASYRQTLSRNVLSSTPRPSGIRTKSNYYTSTCQFINQGTHYIDMPLEWIYIFFYIES